MGITMTLYMDIFEPSNIEELLKPAVPLVRANLNMLNYADYYWTCIDGHTTQLERKQWQELLGEFDIIEEQLRKYMDSADEMGLIVEGILLPHSLGCEVRIVESNGFIRSYKQKRKDGSEAIGIHKYRYSEIIAWLWSLDKQGITYYPSLNATTTAMMLSAFYHNSQKPEHTTLRRYTKYKEPAWQPNRHIANLINLKADGLELGEKKATVLIKEFGTLWGVLQQDIHSLCSVEGVGIKTAQALLKGVGKNV